MTQYEIPAVLQDMPDARYRPTNAVQKLKSLKCVQEKLMFMKNYVSTIVFISCMGSSTETLHTRNNVMHFPSKAISVPPSAVS